MASRRHGLVTSLTALVSAASIAALLGVAGCATIETESTVELRPRAGKAGFEAIELVDRSILADTVQLSNTLVLRLTEARGCRSLLHVPVVRVEQVTRTDPQHAVAWEYGIAGVVGGLSVLAFTRPQLFGARAYATSGGRIEDPRAGYTTGTLFAGIAAASLTAAIIDSTRLRDDTLYTDAFEVRPGEMRSCDDDGKPLRDQNLIFIHGQDRRSVRTDSDGRVVVTLPDGPDGTYEAAVVYGDRAVSVHFVRPFAGFAR
jgi:hypothetical protein